MRSERNYEYFVIRYVPNAASENDANIGVMVLESLEQSETAERHSCPFAGVRFLKDWSSLGPFVTTVDLDVILAIVEEITSKINAPPDESDSLARLLHDLGSASNGVVIGAPRGLVVNDPKKVLDELATKYLPGPSEPHISGDHTAPGIDR